MGTLLASLAAGSRIGAHVVVLHVTPEVLPLITTHDVEVVDLGKILVVLCVGRELQVTLQNLLHAIAAIIDRTSIVTLVVGVLTTLGDVSTACQVQAQILETMYLIVDVSTADKRTADGVLVTRVEQSQRVRHVGYAIEGVRPRFVTLIVGNHRPLEETTQIVLSLFQVITQQGFVVCRSVVIGILCRVEVDGSTDGTTIGILRLGKHTLGIQIHRQVVVQQRRIQVQSGSDTLEVRGSQNTLLVSVAYADTVRQILEGTRKRQVVVHADSGMVNHILPVGVSRTQGTVGNALLAIHIGNELAVLVAIHHVHRLLAHANRHVTSICNGGLQAVATSLLGGDNDDTVRTTATIDGGCRGILQDVERFNILRVQHRKGVRQSLDTFVVHSQTVNHNQRVVGGVQRRTTTNTNLGTAARSTVIADDVHTGYFTCQHVLCIHHDTLVLGVGLQSGHRTGQVALLDSTITDDHHFVQQGSIVLKGNLQRGGCLDSLCLIADIANADVGTLISFQREVTIEVRDGSGLCVHDTYRSTDDGFTLSILNMAFDVNLRKGSYR